MDKELLFKPRLAEEDVEVPGVGTVRVRALNRAESIAVAEAKTVAERDRRLLAAGMVDPALSLAEVGRWQDASPGGEIERVSEVIARLSGMLPGADKEAYKSVRGESAE